jgi:hypothetical protein
MELLKRVLRKLVLRGLNQARVFKNQDLIAAALDEVKDEPAFALSALKENIITRIAFHEETWSELSDKFKEAECKYTRNYIRTQIHQCHIAIETLNVLLKDIDVAAKL